MRATTTSRAFGRSTGRIWSCWPRPGILDDAAGREEIARALDAIDAEIDAGALAYTGEVEDFFFLIEKELKARIGAETRPGGCTRRVRATISTTPCSSSGCKSGSMSLLDQGA